MKKVLILLMLLILVASVTACQSGNKGIGEVTDILGRKVTIDKVPERIISLSPSTTEIVYALGLGDRLVGVDAFSDYPEASQKVEKVGDFNGPNAEKILGLKPDLVLAGNKLQEKAIQQLEKLKVTTVAVESSTYDNIYGSIALVGKVTGTDSKAQELIDTMKKKADDIQAKVKDAEKPSVYYVLSYGEAGNWTSGPGSFINDIIAIAGGDCVTKDGGAPWMEYSLETLIQKDPDVLLVSSDAGSLDDLKKANGYKDLRAVKEGKVYTIDANQVNRPGPRIVDGLEMIAKALHPDLVK